LRHVQPIQPGSKEIIPFQAMTRIPKRIIFIGGGGHARVLADMLDATMRNRVMGYVDPSPAESFPYLHMGDDSVIETIPRDECLLINGLGSVSLPLRRRELFRHFSQLGYRFMNVIHANAVISPGVRLAEGSQVLAGAVLQWGVRVGENAIVNTGAIVDHDCVIGAHSHIAPGVTLSGEIIVGECSHVGAGATVLQGVKIGNHVVIGAGAVVLDPVPDGSTAFGNPARVRGCSYSCARRSGHVDGAGHSAT